MQHQVKGLLLLSLLLEGEWDRGRGGEVELENSGRESGIEGEVELESSGGEGGIEGEVELESSGMWDEYGGGEPEVLISSIRRPSYYFYRCMFLCGYYSRPAFIYLESLPTSRMAG